MTTTHWSHTDDPDQWFDDPATTPEIAIQVLMESGEDDGWEAREELRRSGSVDLTVYGFRETTDHLEDHEQFDGYEPGCSYFAPTGETRKVRVSLKYELAA